MYKIRAHINEDNLKAQIQENGTVMKADQLSLGAVFHEVGIALEASAEMNEKAEKLKTQSDEELIALRQSEKNEIMQMVIFGILGSRISLGKSRPDVRKLLGEPTSTTEGTDYFQGPIVHVISPYVLTGVRIHFENNKVISIEPTEAVKKGENLQPPNKP